MVKISVTREALSAGLQMVNGVVGARPTIPVLSNVLLEAEADHLSLTATDLEIFVRCRVDAKSAKAGVTTLPARRLLSIVRELSAENVEMDTDDKHMTEIASGAAFFKVMGMAVDDFPAPADFSSGAVFTLEAGALKQMLQRVHYAASADETRYILNGCLLSFRGNKLTVVATDGRRLALAEQEQEIPQESETDIVLPSKTVNELLRTLRDEGPVKITLTKNQAAFEFDNVLVISKLIEGTYPNFRQVIPSHCEERVAVEREMLLTAVRRVALMTSEKSSSVRLSFGKNKLKVSASSPDAGEANESLPVKYTGKEMAVAFNPEFIMEPLRTLVDDEIFFELVDELSPGVIKCSTPFLYVLMPMRIS